MMSTRGVSKGQSPGRVPKRPRSERPPPTPIVGDEAAQQTVGGRRGASVAAEATPPPPVRLPAQACVDGVPRQVRPHEKAMLIRLDERVVIPTLDERAAAAVSTVERFHVSGVQVLHPARQRRLAGEHQQVVVIRHLAVVVDLPRVPFRRQQESAIKAQTVEAVEEEHFPPSRTLGDVKDAARELQARFTGHGDDRR